MRSSTAHAVLRALLAACVALGCGGSGAQASRGAYRDVVVLSKGNEESLPFDPRGGRLTIVAREIAGLVGHPIVLELDAALSPELKASLEETVLASFERIARELVALQREEPEIFAKARAIERVACVYDAVAKESAGELREGGAVLVVRAPPDRFPLLERGILTQVLNDAHLADLDARWGDADPAKLAPHEHAPYFAYMTKTRPGHGHLWIATRATRSAGARPRDELRAEQIELVVKLAGVVPRKTPLARKVHTFLLESASFAGSLGGEQRSTTNVDPAVARRARAAYEAWLVREAAGLEDDEKLLLERTLFEPQQGGRGIAFPGFDRFAFGLAVYDGWVKDGARVELPADARGRLHRTMVCPIERRSADVPDSQREIRYGCSRFFAFVLSNERERVRLASAIEGRRDTRLLETALSNLGYGQGAEALALVEALRDDGMFRHGFGVLFHDLARRDDVKSALEKAALRWWRDAPGRRAHALLVMARQWEHLHVHYGDNQWKRLVAELGGPIPRDVLAAYLAQGPRAIEMAPKIWPALTKEAERDELVALGIPVLLAQDREARTARALPALVLLRTRLCGEKNAAGLSIVRAMLARWRSEHPDDAAAVSNALADFTLARCAKPEPPDRE